MEKGYALVTGAYSILGRALCKQLAKQLSVVGVVRRRDVELDALPALPEIRTLMVDLTEPKAVNQVLQGLPKDANLRYVIHAASAGSTSHVTSLTATEMNNAWTANVTAPLIMTSRLTEQLDRTAGRVLFLTGQAGLLPQEQRLTYGLTNCVRALCDQLKEDLKNTRVRVGSLDPGPVESNGGAFEEVYDVFYDGPIPKYTSSQKAAIISHILTQTTDQEFEGSKWNIPLMTSNAQRLVNLA